ncbi:MAG: type VI secretion system baseplate subunit TssG [Rubrivivax sp.]|nr:type VI secretion system baseplate subunit TssG [Rubrivivax sp.]MBK7262559.1 type VI secretion system baseplate subunit TssG [Rubrivivax sp.]
MVTDAWKDTLAQMVAEPWKYDFFQALRRIDAHQPGKPRLGTARRPSDEPVRLGQAPELSFAPAALHAVRPSVAGRPPRVEVRFFGLFGPNGPLPLHLTEYARNRALHNADPTFARFADLFHHRLLLLFYRAWAQAQPVVGRDRQGDDSFADIVGSLIGVGIPAMRGRDPMPDEVKLHFAGLLTRQVRNADGLANLLGGYLGRPVQVEQFAGHWMPLLENERSRLGRLLGGKRNTSAQLGAGAVLGRMLWDRQHGIRLHIGPLDRQAFEALLPDGTALPSVMALVQQYLGHEFDWDLVLGHIAEQVQPSRLGRHARLGWTSWVGQPRPDSQGVAGLRLAPEQAMKAWKRRRASAAAAARHAAAVSPAPATAA